MVDDDHESGRESVPDDRNSRTATGDAHPEKSNGKHHRGSEQSTSTVEDASQPTVSRRKLLGATGAAVGAGVLPSTASALSWCDADTSWDWSWNHHGEINTRCRYRLVNGNNKVEVRDGAGSGWNQDVYIGWPGSHDIESLHIHVHGHNTPARNGDGNASDQFHNIASMMGGTGARSDDHWTFGFSWDSYLTRDGVDDGSWPRWKPSKSIARDNGHRLAAWIDRLKRDGGADVPLFLSGYSLGSQVVLETVRVLKNKYGRDGALEGVFMVGAACPRVAPASGSYYNSDYFTWKQFNKIAMEYETIESYGNEIRNVVFDPYNVTNFFNYWSKNDWVLGTVYPTGERLAPAESSTQALGRYGKRTDYPYDFSYTGYEDIDVSDTIDSHYDYPKDKALSVWDDIQNKKERLLRV